MAALPGDIGVAILIVSELDKRGRKAEADRIFAETFRHFEDICRNYPRSAVHRNGAAWLAARCRRRLADALDHARRAVELTPDKPACIDTMAEVHFQLGDRPKAVELMNTCIRLDPDNPYFRRQRKRFQTGDRATDPEE